MLNHLCQNCKWCPENCSASITNPPCLIKERLGIHLNLRFERGIFFEESQSLVTFVLHSSRQGERLFSPSLTSSENFAWVLWNWRNIKAGWWFLFLKKKLNNIIMPWGKRLARCLACLVARLGDTALGVKCTSYQTSYRSDRMWVPHRRDDCKKTRKELFPRWSEVI